MPTTFIATLYIKNKLTEDDIKFIEEEMATTFNMHSSHPADLTNIYTEEDHASGEMNEEGITLLEFGIDIPVAPSPKWLLEFLNSSYEKTFMFVEKIVITSDNSVNPYHVLDSYSL